MTTSERIKHLLVETQAFKDLKSPVVLASGQLGIYFINAEKLCQDKGKFAEFGNNSQKMLKHIIEMMYTHKSFNEVIDILTEKIKPLFSSSDKKMAISGGQRRDWLFSGPVAKKLNVPHISLYKQLNNETDKIEIIMPDGSKNENIDLSQYEAVHVVDMITEGSSIYRKEGGVKKGWISMLKNKGVTIDHVISVVSRLQGGEERLAKDNIHVHSCVNIDKEFLQIFSSNPQRAIEYISNPDLWSKEYLSKNGALDLISIFDPEKNKMDKAKRFLTRYRHVLEQTGHFDSLKNEVETLFNIRLESIEL